MNKKKLLMFVIPIVLSLTLVVAAIVWYHQFNVTVNVDEAFSSTQMDAIVSGKTGETVIQEIPIHNSANVDLYTNVIWTERSNSYVLDNSAGTCEPYPSSTCEKRVHIEADEVGIDTLDDLIGIEWEANVIQGYLPHIDVLIDTDNDGISDDALVFEYAKADSENCDNTPYPIGLLNTFADKGKISDTTYAWVSSGDAGPCTGSPTFFWHSLYEWKNQAYANGKIIDGDTKVIALELEVDNWISASSSTIKNLKINGNKLAGVIYSFEVIGGDTQVVPAGSDKTITVKWTMAPDTNPGILKGIITLNRVASP